MNLLQFLLIASAFAVVFAISTRRPGMAMVVLCGFVFRSGLAVLDYRQLDLPWSGADSARFYAQVLTFVREPVLQTLTTAPISGSSMYPWVNSWIARIAGTEYLFLAFINVLVGTFTILQIHSLAGEFLNKRQALVAAWFACLFPVSAILSAVFLRETFITAFMIAAFRQLALAIKRGTVSHVVIGALMIFLAAMFHGALILCLLLFPLGYLVANIVQRRRVDNNAASPLRLLIVSGLLLGIIFGFGPRLSKIGSLDDIPEIIDARARRESNRRVATNSDYPVFLSQNIYRPDIAGLRYIYFMFAPFPWSWRGLGDIAGTLLGVANAYAFWMVFRARKKLQSIPLTMFFGVLLTTLMYSSGVSNVGTAIRHRNKALPVLFCAALAARAASRKRHIRETSNSLGGARFMTGGRMPEHAQRWA